MSINEVRYSNVPTKESDSTEVTEDSENEDGSFLINGKAPEDGSFPKARHVLGLLGFLGFANVYAMRVNLSVAIVAMVNHTAIPKNESVLDVCPIPTGNTTTPMKDGDFIWDEATQSIVLGSFFYGYVLTQVPGGRLSEVIGSKKIYGFGILITSIFTLLTPFAAKWNMTALVIVRILEGMGEGVTYPSMHGMLAKWIPPLERGTFAALVYAGSNFGTLISLPLSGWLCSLDFYGGWPLAFYIFGLLGLVWCLCWLYFVYDTPQMHPRISTKEKLYIEFYTKRNDDILGLNNEPPNVPWKSIFSSLPFWAILVTQCGQAWAFYTLLTELPTYMDNILHTGIQQNAILSALPYLTSYICGILCSLTADWLLKKGWISQKNSYKLWNTISAVIPSLGLMGVTWANCDKVWVMIMLAGFGAFQGASYAGNQMNHIALSPKYAATMYGMTNATGNICGFLAPFVVGLIIKGHESFGQWRIVFLLAASVNITGNFFYLLFASADEQPWSR